MVLNLRIYFFKGPGMSQDQKIKKCENIKELVALFLSVYIYYNHELKYEKHALIHNAFSVWYFSLHCPTYHVKVTPC